MTISIDETQQIHHVARLSVLAMCARGVAASEFALDDDVQAITITVRRPCAGQPPEVQLDLFGFSDIAIGGMEL